jgi:FlaA1/EpsC-like NDP-sugar epimerase
MGASKRLAELYIQWLNTCSRTVFAMVRFGNVLGSACSVLPIWSQQLAQGLPLTVTHPDMTRYFMTIPEAAGLVIQSAAYAGTAPAPIEGDGAGSSLTDGPAATPPAGGDVFLLDMGRPVRILDLARRFIAAHALEPDRDVPIQITGIRPGEKLYEELAYDTEEMLPTPHASIRRWRTAPPTDASMRRIIQMFDRLRDREGGVGHPWQHASPDSVVTALRVAVPEMVPSAVRRAAG